MEMQSTLKLDEVLTGITYSRQAVTHFDLCKQYEGKTFGNPELMAQYKPDKMISIPLLNPNNLDHVQYIINIFPLRDAELMDDETLNELSFVAAIGAQSVVDEYCSNSVAEINYIFSRYKSVSSFIEAFVSFIKDHIDCEGVSVFLVNDLQNRLELRGTTGIEWHVPPEERFYKIGEGHTGKTWKTGRTLLTIELKDDVAHIAKSTEIVKYQQVRSCLFAPFFDPYGNVFGVIRCNNKKSLSFPGKFCSFSEIDLAIMDSICQAAAPFMNVLIEKERRFRALGRLTHELKVPVIAIRGATQSIISEARNKLVFEFDYPGDIWSWTELMQRLLDVSDFMRFRFEEIKLSLSPTLLMKEVVAPAIRQIGYLLKAKDMSIHAIHYQGFDQIPRLWIDKNMFQQVFFNLLSNAIKFSYDDPSSFRVEISGFSTNEGFGIKFQDWGEGILLGTEKVIFEEGIRGPTSLSKGVASQGLGLWLCKEIIALHGGIISVTNLSLPTEFTILLPEELSKAKRSDYRKESRI